MPRTKARKEKTPRTEKSVDKVEKDKTTPEKPAGKAAAKAPRGKRAKAAEKPVEEPVLSDVEETTETVGESPSKRKRSVPTRDSVLEGFDGLQTMIEDEIGKRREDSSKARGVKFLRSLNKKVKTLRSQAARVMKQRHRTNRKNNNNSGFLKPVKISNEMAKFTGWDPAELKSRVDVTKYICKYIKDHDLQNPDDRRQIRVDKDNKLRKLLGYDGKKDEAPLTYYRLQTYMKKHFVKEDTATEEQQ